jgi:ABC-type transport system involved in multi-copper enzyme maturation permease subunit
MNYRNVVAASAVVSIIYGLLVVLAPQQAVSLYNVELNPPGILVAHLFGSSLLGLGLLNWFAREFQDASVQKAVLTANLVSSTLGTIFSLIAQLGGVPGANALGWSTVVLYLLFALAFAYLRFMRQ